MIILYEGVPGSGKSLYAAGQILEQLSLGHLVITNFPVEVPPRRMYRRGALVVVNNSELSPELLHRWYQIWLKYRRGGVPKEHQICLVVDECGTVFNPRDWQSQGRKAWLSFFAQHRKLMYDVILIVQQDIMIDKQIRGCIDVAERFSDVRKFLPGQGWYFPPVFKRMSRVYLSKDSRAGKIGTHFFGVRRSWAAAYSTFQLFDGGQIAETSAPCPVIPEAAEVPCYRWKRPLNVALAAKGHE